MDIRAEWVRLTVGIIVNMSDKREDEEIEKQFPNVLENTTIIRSIELATFSKTRYGTFL